MRRKVTISLPESYETALRAVANRLYEGNVSAVIRALMDGETVTKSEVALALRAT